MAMMQHHHARLGVADTLAEIADLLERGEHQHAVEVARQRIEPAPCTTIVYPLPPRHRTVATKVEKPSLTPSRKLPINLRDGFIDRYSPERWRLVNPGALRVLSLRLGEAMATEISRHSIPAKYATNSPVWFDVWPAVDHIEPRAAGGGNDSSNLVTCSWWRNDSKRDRPLVETGWELQPPGSLDDWDGLTTWFSQQVARDAGLLSDPMVANWHRASRGADQRGIRCSPLRCGSRAG
jgi:hypothetical protein